MSGVPSNSRGKVRRHGKGVQEWFNVELYPEEVDGVDLPILYLDEALSLRKFKPGEWVRVTVTKRLPASRGKGRGG